MDAIRAYRESEIASDSPVHLVVLLYDQLLRDLQRALDAFVKEDVARRALELDHALLVLGQLQGTIDLARGGEVAETLDHFYTVVRRNLLQAAAGDSGDLLERQRQQIFAVREAWLEVERKQGGAVASSASGAEKQSSPQPGSSEWKV